MKLIRSKLPWLIPSALLVLTTWAATDVIPPIGKIDFYGLQRSSANDLRRQLELKEGDPTPTDGVAEIERRLETTPGVYKAKVSATCCEDGKSTVFVGIEEQAGSGFVYNPPPGGAALLPKEVAQAYDDFMKTLTQEVQAGKTQEDDSQGHALFSSPALQPFQRRFMTFAETQAEVLRAVLRDSADAKSRATAAWLLGYAPDKRSVLADLLHAVRDPDETVRNNATRSIAAIAVLARAKPQLGIVIEPDVFIQMLNSLSWSDRNKAMMVLLGLSEQASEVLAKMRAEALSSLVEMARWKDGHSLMALRLVGSIAGVGPREAEVAWREGRREEIIRKALPATTRDFSAFFGGREGCFVLYNAAADSYLRYNPTGCTERFSPCSTFKIANSLIALETGVASGADFSLRWDGVVHPIASWNHDHNLRSAFSNSVVWFYQELARRVGSDRMTDQVRRLNYGNNDTSGGITNFWLESSLRISADEQVELLRRLWRNDLPFRPDVQQATRELMKLSVGDRVLYGKTGTGGDAHAGVARLGWFVGCVENKGTQLFFATRITGEREAGGRQARQITEAILNQLLDP